MILAARNESIRETGHAAQTVSIVGLRGNDSVACISALNGTEDGTE